MHEAPLLTPWPQFEGLPCRTIEGSNINQTWSVGIPPVAVVQRLSPVLWPQVNLDIEAVTAHLESRGMATPRLIRTRQGALCHLDDPGACWRALTWISGTTYHRLDNPRLAHQAGILVGRWHRATAELEHEFAFVRTGAHDTEAHMTALATSLARHTTHRLREQVVELSERILESWETWSGVDSLPAQICHGDLKISNLRFDDEGHGICLIDLDTMGYLALDIELADAWRSWCNPRGEDVVLADFDIELFAAAVHGYHGENPLTSEAREVLVAATERICLELAARFLADALNESYFAWDPGVAPGRGEHNLKRATGQYHLSRSVREQRRDIERVLRELPRGSE